MVAMTLSFRKAAVAVALLVAWPCLAIAGANPAFTLPLHAAPGWHGCGGYQPIDCLSNRPVTSVAPNELVTVFLLAANYSAIAGMQAGLSWDPSWSSVAVFLDCQPGQTGQFFPGATSVSLVTSFFCVQGPALLEVGRVVFQVGQEGCVRYVQPTHNSDPILVMDCQGLVDQITDNNSSRLGRVCVGLGGHDACDPVVPVGSVTWGRIKQSYR